MARAPQRKDKGSTGWAIEQTPLDLNAIADAIKPVDRVAADMERKWGASRLPFLVSPDLAGKFGSARDKWHAAVRAGDPELVRAKGEVVVRGWQALDAAATAAGHEPMPAQVWSATHEGRRYAVCARTEDAHKVAVELGSGITVLSLSELLMGWQMLAERRMVEAAKAVFPGATVEKLDKARGDVLPF